MDHLPPKPPRTDAPAVWPQPRSPDDRTAARSMAHPRDREREREREPRDRDRDRDRERDRPPFDDVWAASAGPARRDDVYVPTRDAGPPAYSREGRVWARDERDGRDTREWTRDGRERRDERHYRSGGYPERGGWPDDRARERDRDRTERERERERYRDWERESRDPYERPRERGWERDERSKDMDVRYGGDNFRSAHPRRQELDNRHRSPPRSPPPPPHSRRSPSPPHRAPQPARSPAYRGRDERSVSRIQTDDVPPPSGRRQRDDSVNSRRSSIRRGGDERVGPIPHKRERSSSPTESARRAHRRLRTASASPGEDRSGDRRRSPSPLTKRREEKQPERASPLSPPPSGPAGDRDRDWDRRERRGDYGRAPAAGSAAFGSSRRQRSPPRRRAPNESRNASPGVTPSTRSIPTGPAQRSGAPSGSTSPIPNRSAPANAPTGPRSSAVQPPPARLPVIPPYSPTLGSKELTEIARFEQARPGLYAEVARTSAAVRRAASDVDISTIELRAAEQRRVLAGMLRQQLEA